MKSSPMLRVVQAMLSLILVVGQFALPLDALAESFRSFDLKRSDLRMTSVSESAPLLSPAALDAQFVRLVADYVNTPEAATASEGFQEGYAFAQSLYANAIQRELVPTLLHPFHRDAAPVLGLSAGQVNAAFMRLLGAYFAMPAELSDAESARYEDTFAVGFQALTALGDRLAPVGDADGDEASFDNAFLQALEDYMNSATSGDASPPSPSYGEGSGVRSMLPSPSHGEGPGVRWSLDASDPATGQEVSWQVMADPVDLAAFDAAFTHAMQASPGPPDVPEMIQGASPVVGAPDEVQSEAVPEVRDIPDVDQDAPPAFVDPSAIQRDATFAQDAYLNVQETGWSGSLATTAHDVPEMSQSVRPSAAERSEVQRAPAKGSAPAPQPVQVAAAPRSSVRPATAAPKTVFAAPDPSRVNAPLYRASGVAGFVKHTVSTLVDLPLSVTAADVDGDGDMDILSASALDDKIAWYENDGSQSFTPYTITTVADDARSVTTADVDRDGDLDVLSASGYDDKIAWYENDGLTPPSFTPYTITTDAVKVQSVHAADMDGDGDMDVLSASYGDDKVAWYENDGSQNFTAYTITIAGGAGECVTAADVDGDGDMDVLSSDVAWYENDGAQNFTSHIITANGAESVATADVDRDGDVDVLAAFSLENTIAWYENDGAQNFTPYTITTAASGATAVAADDVDGDGDMDVLAASYTGNTIAWYENDGQQTFTAHAISAASDGPESIYTADVDSDGDLDVLAASSNDNTIAWYENRTLHYSANFPTQFVISAAAVGATSVTAADVDRDGDMDILSASAADDKIAWYANDGAQNFDPYTITTAADGAMSVTTADVDSDGDTDVLSASYNDGEIAWYENDGSQIFTTHTITTIYHAESVYAADVDGDGDVDVLSASGGYDSKVVWYENDGSQNFTAHTVTTAVNLAHSVYATDVDSDGDIDALGASSDPQIAWYENSGSQSFTAHTIDATDVGVCLYATDMDGDGDIDALSGALINDKIIWYENDGNQSFTAHVIATDAVSPREVYAADVDGDGDMDVLAALEDDVAWYENNGNQTFTAHIISTAVDVSPSVHAADVDGDGDLDILSASELDNKIAWYENTGGQYRLSTLATAPITLENGHIEDVFRVDLTHLGRSGDGDAELTVLGLRFTDLFDAPLSSEQVNALLDGLHLYRDTGSGNFEAATDTLVASMSMLNPSNGYQAFTLPDGAPAAQVSAGETQSFFVVLELADDANAYGLHNLRVTHVASGFGGTQVEDSTYDRSMELESSPDLSVDLFLLPYWHLTFGNPGLSGGDVNAVVISDTTTYVGGSFTGKVAQWNGNSWSTLGSLDGDVHALAISGTVLYAGGAFTGKLARWTGSVWELVGSGLNSTVYALAAGDGSLYVGGDFTNAGGGTGADRIVRWDGGAWHALGDGANGIVRAIALRDADVFIGGDFTLPAPYVAQWEGSTWQTLGGATFSDVYALSVAGSDLYAGDSFGALKHWDGSTWHVVGGGLSGSTLFVNALATNGSDLFVGGIFTGAGGIPMPNLARWNGFRWTTLDAGTNGTVNALALGNNGLGVGGAFSVVGGDIESNKIAAWEPPLTDLNLAYTVAPTTTPAGVAVTYTLTLTNSSGVTATNVTLGATLPDGLTPLAQSAACTATGQAVTCTLSGLAPSVTQALTLTAATPITDRVYTTSTAFVSADQPESNGMDNHADAPPINVTVESDLALGIAVPAGVIAGRGLTYTFVVTNYGPSPAPTVVLTDILSTGLTFLAATPACIEAEGNVSCALGDLPVGATRTVTLTAAVPADFGAGTATNRAGVASDAIDPVPGNHTAQTDTTVTVEADLAVALSAPSLVCISGTLYTTLVVTNSGPSQATGVSLSDSLPAGATFASASAACAHAGGTVTCAVGDLVLDARRTYTVALNLSSLIDYAVITHSVSASAASSDPAPEDNTATVTTSVRTDCSAMQADLSLNKTGPTTVVAGGLVTYTLTAWNHGSLGATEINISDTLPTDISFVSADPACTHDGTITCTVGALAAGQFRSYTLVGAVAVDTTANTTLTNTARVSGNEIDFLPENNTKSAVSLVTWESDLVLSKTAPVTASTGVPLVYTLTVTNHGPSHAAGVVLTDTLPAEVIFDAVATDQGTCTEADGRVTCALGALNTGLSTTVHITVTPFQGGTILNTASVAATTSDPAPSNNAATATLLIAGGRETRVYDHLRVTANAFFNLGGGEVQAMGDIWLGAEGGDVEDPIALSGADDTLIIDTATHEASGNGTVRLRDGAKTLFSGAFTVTGTVTEPRLTPTSAITYAFDALADFNIDAGLTVTDTNLSTGGTRGLAMLAVQSQAVDESLQADFEILPGPEYVATLATFDFTVAGCVVTVTAPQLGNMGIGADDVLLTLPEKLGNTSISITDLQITPSSLSFGEVGATFPLPDIKFGSGEKVKIVDAEAGLIYYRASDVFAFTASGTLSLTLPSNTQAIAIKLRVDTEGNLSASLDQLSLKIAGSTLQMQDIGINNSGLTVAAAILTLPPSFKGATATLSDIAITGDGLSIGGAGATIPLPDLKIGSGSKVKFTDLRATLEIADLTGDPAYTFGIAGTLALRLPQNSQDIAFTAQIDGDGNFSGTLDQLSLTMAKGKANLKLETIAFDNSGLDVETGTLSLSLGSTPVTGTVTALRIDDGGISVGGGSVTVAIPDIKVGSGKRFSLTDATVTLELGGDRSYKLTLAGTMDITIPGTHASATASISVDGDGNISGSVQSFALTVAGLGLTIENARLQNGMLLVDKAAFEIPPAWGGFKAELYQLRIGGSSGLSIGGGKFALPDMEVGKLKLAGLVGGFVPVDGGYEITAEGLFKVPGLGGGPNCGIKVGVTLYADGGRTVMAIRPLELPEPVSRAAGLAKQMATFRQTDSLSYGPGTPEIRKLNSLALKEVTCGLEGCRIPIGTTGFLLERVEGTLTLDEGTTHIDLGVTIITRFGLGPIPAVAGDADLGIDFDPFKLDFVGTVTLFAIFEAARLEATLDSAADFFSADLRIQQLWPPFVGTASLSAWTTGGDFHLVGQASLAITFRKGTFFDECAEVLPWCCDWWGIICTDPCMKETCLRIPPFTFAPSVHAEFGEFYRGSDTTWGLKGWVDLDDIPGIGSVLDYFSVPSRFGFYFNTDGDLRVGDVDSYHTITPPRVARALALQEQINAGKVARMALSEADRDLLDAYHVVDDTTTVTFTVPTTTDLLFYLVRVGDVPTMTLVHPDGSAITPSALPANAGYGTFTTTNVLSNTATVTDTNGNPVTETQWVTVTETNMVYAVEDADPGTWQVKLELTMSDVGYIATVFGVPEPPVLTDLRVTDTGMNTAQAGWSLSSSHLTTTLNIYASPGPITVAFTITDAGGRRSETSSNTEEVMVQPRFSGYAIATDVPTLLDGTPQTTTLDLSGLESGTYYVWFDVQDTPNTPPIRAYAPTTVTVRQAWQDTWTANVRATPGFRELALAWDASPNPDVDGYHVYLSPDPIAPMAGQLFDIGDLLTTTLHTLTPGQVVYLTVGAVDADTGRIALSEAITATPSAAAFTLNATPRTITLVAGETAQLSVDVATPWPTYPGVVGLRTSTPDGVALAPDTDIVTPTMGGVTVGLTLSTTARLPGGIYTATLHGAGPGAAASVPFTITVQEPTFTLNAPSAITLRERESQAINITVDSVHGGSAPVYLSLEGAPAGLRSTFSHRTVLPGANATLYLTDTGLLNGGAYTLTLSGEDGASTRSTDITLNVEKPGFALSTARPRRLVLYGETVTYTLDVDGFMWSDAVRVMLAEADPVGGSTFGFRETPGGPLNDILTVTVPSQVYLVTTVTSATVPGLYLPMVVATSQGRQDDLDLMLMVYETATQADLEVMMTGDSVVLAGTGYVYTATVTNYGPLPATDVHITTTIPATGVSLNGATPSQGAPCIAAGHVVTCAMGDLARNTETTVRVALAVSPAAAEGTLLVSQAEVGATEPDTGQLDNVASHSTLVSSRATLALDVAAVPQPVVMGETLAYHLTLTNQGPADAVGVQVVGSLPNRLTFTGATAGCTHALGLVTCELGRVAAGAMIPLVISTTVGLGAPGSAQPSFSASAANGVQQPQAVVSTAWVDQALSGLTVATGGLTRLGEATGFNATIAMGTNVVYEWDFGDGLPPAGGDRGGEVTHVYANVGVYPVVVTATNAAVPEGITATTAAIVYAAYTWNGSVSTDGAEPRNWTPYTGQAPTRYDTVTLPANPTGQYWPEVSGAWHVDDLTLERGAALTLLDGAQLVVDGTVVNAGTLRQTVATVPAGSTTRFLHIRDAAGRVDQYLGVDITPAEALGPVTVAVMGQAACPQATGPTVRRCFTVVGAGTATLTFHYLERERAGLDAAMMQVWHWDKAAQQWGLVGNVSGRDTGSAHYAVTVEGVVLDASGTRFVLRPNNVPPEADDDGFTVAEDSGATVLDVLANDTDADGDTLRVYAVGPLDQGGTLVNAGTHVVYTPAPDFFGMESFTYIVSDGFGGLDTATVAVAVTAVADNRAPVADAGGAQSVEPGAQVILDGSRSYDPDGDPLTYYWTQDGGPVVLYTPHLSVTTFTAPTQRTAITFTLTVTDPAGLSDSDRAVIRVARMHRLYLPLMVKGVVGKWK